MDTQYRNVFNAPLTPQQVALEEIYFKDSLISGVIKITEEYMDDVVIHVTYFKDTTELDSQIISQYTGSKDIEAVYIRERSTYGTYRIETEHSYFRNEQSGQFELQATVIKWLYNANGDNIAYEVTETDLPANDPDYRGVKKFYYFGTAPAGAEKPYFTSIFDENENFECLFYHPDSSQDEDQDTEEYPLPDALTWMTQIGIPQNMQTWYTNDVFLPPI